jgi:mono/diheme cytochrome c family protein
VTLRIDPNRAGPNSYRVELRDAGGAPVTAQRVFLELTHQEMEMGQRQVVAQPIGEGRYEAGGGQLSMTGAWNVAVVAVLRGPDGLPAETRLQFPITVGQPLDASRALFSPARILLFSLTPQLGLSLVVLAMAALILRLRVRRPRQALPLLVAGATLCVVGGVAGGASVASGYRLSLASATPLVNPVEPTAESIARGQLVYAQNCLVCHGAQGRGDGPAARALRPPPADLRVHMAAGHTDAQLYDWVTNGVAGTAMPAWKHTLSELDRWNVINYIRTLAGAESTAAATPAAGAGTRP